MSDTQQIGQVFPCTAGTNDNDIMVTVVGPQSLSYDTWVLASTAGSMDVEVAVVGTTYLASRIALLDGTSTTPSTLVNATTAGKVAIFRGKFTAIRVRQDQAAGVVAPSLIGYRTA